ncbi:hypothetical protein GLOIN_2v744250 [Rhizophagus clarus]|uniref:F-box domain-containing protein n=1 Tax=Rhizophagus clarus TaxID=94130 RepID=A0A8H3QGN7_9GLOM|nr:hypothetical protein GLOIN_2v744250 [Rhizophagus clarus]
MHIVTLLERLPPELIPFIVKNLSNQDLKNFRSINDTWAKEIDLEWFTLFDFSTMSLVQGENTVKDLYSKLEECNKSFGHSEEFLKCALLKGLSTENAFKVSLDGLEKLASTCEKQDIKHVGEQNLKLEKKHYDILHKEEITSQTFLGLTSKEELQGIGLKLGPVKALLDEN